MSNDDARITCPKCKSSNTWLEFPNDEIILHCKCGYLRVMYTPLEGSIQVDLIDMGGVVKLPKPQTALSKCLASLYEVVEGTTQQVLVSLVSHGENVTCDQVASNLAVLRSRGLVEIVTHAKGISGGSTWKVSKVGLGLLEG